MSLGGGTTTTNGLQIATSSSNSNGHSVNRYSSALAAVEQDEATNDDESGGWGNEDDDLFADNGFEPMESFEPSTPSPMPSFATMKPTVPAAPLRPSTNASSSMALGGGANTSAKLGFGAMESGKRFCFVLLLESLVTYWFDICLTMFVFYCLQNRCLGW